MKSTRKIIPALAMLIVSAVVMTTASYAWFSMNTQVTAKGMTVTAKSDSTYLLIGTANSAETIQAAKTIEADLAMEEATKLYPSRVKGTPANDSALKFEYTQAASASSSPAAEDAEYTEISSENINDYVLKKTFYVTVQKGAAAASNLTVKSVTFGNLDNSGIACVVTTASKAVNAKTNLTDDTNVLAASVTDESVVAVNVYIYINGESSNVYTDNFSNLDAGTLTIVFDVNRVE